MSMFHKRKLTLGLIGGGVILIVVAAAAVKLTSGQGTALTGALGFLGLIGVVAGGFMASYGLRCPKCGKRLHRDWRITECPDCGAPLD